MRTYLSIRKTKSHQYPFFRCIIPCHLQRKFGGTTDFRLSLSCVSGEDEIRIICLKLKQTVDAIFTTITIGMKNLSLDEIKEILRIEVRKQIEHARHYALGTDVWDNVKKSVSLQNVASRETKLLHLKTF